MPQERPRPLLPQRLLRPVGRLQRRQPLPVRADNRAGVHPNEGDARLRPVQGGSSMGFLARKLDEYLPQNRAEISYTRGGDPPLAGLYRKKVLILLSTSRLRCSLANISSLVAP